MDSATLKDLQKRRMLAQRIVDQNYEKIENLEAEIEEYEREVNRLSNEILKAEALADKDAYPVGTRVRHYRFTDIVGTVVESDGAGLSVLDDGSTSPRHGYAKREWEEI
jgi:predicted RNase H-like nuclease (RuvC/YqgF family)